ncbi:MAG: hypothetical protein IKB07_13590 [Lachnospiraceae bacterium]|nr:hypothetical protein [Lachnospiraceae bacterium]
MALIQPVKDGKIENTAIESTKKETKGTSELGKDAFLQLLVAQMKFQDPLNPTSDTEYIAQLAQFSQLEQMQNLAATNENSQMLSMVGKEVCVSSENEDGTLNYKQGVVEGVTISGGKAYLTVDGSLYDSEHLVEVYDAGYLLEQKMPDMTSQYFIYDGTKPQNFSFEVDFGTEEAKATEIALIVDGEQIINPEYIRKNKNYFTVNQDVFHQLTPGKHTISVMFNNAPYYTTKENVIEVDVIHSEPKEDTDIFIKDNPVEAEKNEAGQENTATGNEENNGQTE